MHFSQHILCTGKMELALDVKFYLDFHCVTRPWRRTPTNGSDVNYVFPRCRHYQSERAAGSQSLIPPRRLGSFGGEGFFERIPKERRIHPLFVVRLGRIGFELSLPGYWQVAEATHLLPCAALFALAQRVAQIFFRKEALSRLFFVFIVGKTELEARL